jgi:outer membrane biosynthesis protein TonB
VIAINSSNFLKHAVDINPAFDAENLKHNRSSKINSGLITILFYACLLLILYFLFGLQPPYPPLSDQGVFLNIGLADEGMGDVQPMGTSEQLDIPSPAPGNPVPKEKTQDVLTQETNEDVPVIPKKESQKKTSVTNTTPQKKTNNNPPAPDPPKPKPKALYPGNTSNNSASEGTGNKPGDQGKPNGNPFGDSYSGNPGMGGPGLGGSGGSAQLGMSGRKIIYYPSIIDNSQKTGKVVVNIKVDKQGNVTFAKATQKGSTTTDTYLFQLAEQAAMKTRVNADPDAAEEQFGRLRIPSG